MCNLNKSDVLATIHQYNYIQKQQAVLAQQSSIQLDLQERKYRVEHISPKGLPLKIYT